MDCWMSLTGTMTSLYIFISIELSQEDSIPFISIAVA